MYQNLWVRRDSWMARQLKHLLSVASGPAQRPVRALLVTGLGHATVLEDALKGWCDFHYLIDLDVAKAALAEHINTLNAGYDHNELKRFESFRQLRQEFMEMMLEGSQVPPGDVAALMEDVCPGSLTAPRAERFYHADGALACQMPYRDDKIDGLAQWFDQQGHTEAEVTYQAGVRHGIAKQYDADGKLKQEHTYTNGLVEGPAKTFYEDGTVYAEFSYHNGKYHGVMKYFGRDGQFEREERYEDGVRMDEQ